MDEKSTTIDVERKTSEINVKIKKSKVIRNLLIGATLSTAFVSLITTAQGLEMYIFQGNLLFAGVISGAIQGTLYTLSIAGISLLRSKLLHGVGKGAAVLIWGLLLVTSSIFSYVYVSKVAYSDEILRSDAEQNMSLFLQKESFINLECVEKLMQEELKNIADYTSLLNGGLESGITVNQEDTNRFEKYINTFQSVENKYSNTDESASFSTTNIRMDLEELKSGRFTQQKLETCKESLKSKENDISSRLEYYESEISTLDEHIRKETARLTSFGTVHSPEWQESHDHREEMQQKRNQYDTMKNALSNFRKEILSCLEFVEKEFETGTENKLNQLTKSLYAEVNKDQIDTEIILGIAEEIYSQLIDANPSSDTKKAMAEYTMFKQDISDYRHYVEDKQLIESEIEILGNYTQTMVTNTGTVYSAETADSFEADTSVSRDESMSNTEDGIDLGFEKKENPVNVNNEENDNQDQEDAILESIKEDEWSVFWSQRLANMLKEIRNLPQELIDKDRITKDVMDRRRLYLFQLNDFDRALTLARESIIGFHEHGTMVIVSLIFAFSIDLFSMATGIMLYYFRPSTRKKVSKLNHGNGSLDS